MKCLFSDVVLLLPSGRCLRQFKFLAAEAGHSAVLKITALPVVEVDFGFCIMSWGT